jgi:protein gp37
MHTASPRHRDAQIVQSTVQWGGRTPKTGGRELDGRMWDEMPTRNRASVA